LKCEADQANPLRYGFSKEIGASASPILGAAFKSGDPNMIAGYMLAVCGDYSEEEMYDDRQ
jgi:hypothetical protein